MMFDTTGATLVVTYDNGDNCPNAIPPVNRKVVISYTCNQVRAVAFSIFFLF